LNLLVEEEGGVDWTWYSGLVTAEIQLGREYLLGKG
jgi:hypothetical protein